MKAFAYGFVERTLEKLEKALEKLEFKFSLKKPQSLRVMSYQLEFKPFESLEEALYFYKIRLKEFTRYVPKVIVFPRYTVNLLMGLVPFSHRRLLTSKGFVIIDKYFDLFKEAYRRILMIFGKHTDSLVIGGTLFSEKEELLFIYKDGTVTVSKIKTPCLIELEGTKFAFVKPEKLLTYSTTRELQEAGIRVIFTSESFGNFDEWKMRLGIWARSQSIGIFGVNSVMVGKILGETHEGVAFVSAPAFLTRNLDGFIVKLVDPKGRGIAIADIDIETLENYLANLPKTYRKYRSLV